ncbi:MAG: dTDP-4-dehydrorhamnose reductase [Chloroflexi bacterium]|nr:dTDP-4-dehydrorhamnose reductase [Chloroflexota bacterium]
MQILITGVKGRLGSQLLTKLSVDGHTVSGFDIDTTDITNLDSVTKSFASAQPELVLHCAALTAVDYCAEHPDDALRVNGLGTQNIAIACQRHGAALLYISTNEVFNGQGNRPYLEYDLPAPINSYGYSKWVGEQIVRDLLPHFYLVRTSWLFAHGGNNFIQTILRLAGEGRALRVVTNEVSTPTYTEDLVGAIARLITTGRYGIYHLVNEGYASRYAFAQYALEQAGYDPALVKPITLAEYQRASRPPEYSVLRNFAAAQIGITLRPWQAAVDAFLAAEPALKNHD